MHDFHEDLIVCKWLFSHLLTDDLGRIRNTLESHFSKDILLTENTRFFDKIVELINFNNLSIEVLQKYDSNIEKYWREITKERNRQEKSVLTLQYFQYLALLFTEIYLDWYFNKPAELLNALNRELSGYLENENNSRFRLLQIADLNKIALWCATGSGKTLLMHVNVKQYLHYYALKNRNAKPDKILVLTPNEGLSNQHLDELKLSGVSMVQRFSKRSSPLSGTIEVIENSKLEDSDGDQTVDVKALEGNNLVLVDEGHKGSSSDSAQWLRRRDILCRGGFSFEYSATFGQVVHERQTIEDVENTKLCDNAKLYYGSRRTNNLTEQQLLDIALTEEDKQKCRISAVYEVYAKSIIFDYSYKYFYKDGYGKDSIFLNQATHQNDERNYKFFFACMLSFYQQLYLWEKNKDVLEDYKIEKPLWIFVGNSVSVEDSDILVVLKFFSYLVTKKEKLRAWIEALINDEDYILNDNQQNPFKGRFEPISKLKTATILNDMFLKVFNSSHGNKIQVTNLKKATGEVALSVGGGNPFAIINVGNDSAVLRQVSEIDTFVTKDDEFTESLFESISEKNSKINVLIGSRKFIEGWSSWRVSTMGLLNLGRGVGAQIIQLFGRGVRLKGKDYSLKRSSPDERPSGVFLEYLETLNIFGVRADYVAQFQEYFTEEGVESFARTESIEISTRDLIPKAPLKVLQLKSGYKDYASEGFMLKETPYLFRGVPKEYEGKIVNLTVKLDLYPNITSFDTNRNREEGYFEKNEFKLDQSLYAFFDFDKIYLNLLELKKQNQFFNLRIELEDLIAFCNQEDDSWYTLCVPPGDLEFKTFSDIRKYQDVLERLLAAYMVRFYRAIKGAYEGQHFQAVKLEKASVGFIDKYTVQFRNDEEGIRLRQNFGELQSFVQSQNFTAAKNWHQDQIVSICFDRHLFFPLLSVGFEDNENLPVKIYPKALGAPSEINFLSDLEKFLSEREQKSYLNGKDIYLLRNADNRHQGVGFAMAGNFYPDFLLWIVDGEKQWLTFIDPKGILRLDPSDPKFQLYKEIKVIEKEIGDKDFVLEAFILSVTRFQTLRDVTRSNETKKSFENRNVLFMLDDENSYLDKMFRRILNVA